ncbi:MAG: hypothetical protein HUU57_04585 [Bdellovibrio sp.]|nr:hypothetical protein [Bdellovibrio sp.]
MTLKKLLLTTCLFLVCTSTSWAASVSGVKGQKVLIKLDGDTVSEGEEFFLINPANNKKTALVRIRQIKGDKALADLVKGKAAQGFSLQAKGMTAMSADPSYSGDAGGILRNLKNSYGITGGMLMNTMTANVTAVDSGTGIKTTSEAKMAGSGFGVGGFYDMLLTSSIVGRGVVGIEQFNVSGDADSAVCSGSKSCDAKINYLSLYGLAKWYLSESKYRFWLGGGGGYLIAVSKTSTALNASQISTNQIFTAAFGLDVQTTRKNYIPVSIEYNMFPSSDTVKASMISIKAGWAWNL